MKPINIKPLFDFDDAHYMYLRTSDERYKRKMDALEESNAKTEHRLRRALQAAKCYDGAASITIIEIIRNLQRVEKFLDIPKKYMNGISVEVNPYRDSATTPMFYATYRNGGWTITDIQRKNNILPNRRAFIRHTKESKDAIIQKYSNIF